MSNLKIDNNKDIIASPEKMDMNVNKATQSEVYQTKSILDRKESVDGDSIPNDHFDIWRGHLILQCVVISTCSISYLIFRKDAFDLQHYIPDDVLPFGIMLTLVSIFALGASYLYAQLMSERFIRITLRNKLAAAQTDEFIRSMHSANADMAEMSLTQLDERIRMMVAKNEDFLRLSGAETDQKIRKLISENDQQIRLLAAMTDERIRLLTPENDEYTKLMPQILFGV
ncbi:hypothetical protein TNCV_351471 [Trichonephila clavipes]|nr:hypothetical protein TNCV_351471 [Trichonephila clavipes]